MQELDIKDLKRAMQSLLDMCVDVDCSDQPAVDSSENCGTWMSWLAKAKGIKDTDLASLIKKQKITMRLGSKKAKIIQLLHAIASNP